MPPKKQLSADHKEELFKVLKTRFEKNMHRHKDMEWNDVQSRLEAHPDTLYALDMMEETGGEPDVIGKDKTTGEYIIVDCVAESPKGRRSVCYDHEALEARKQHKPKDSAMNMADSMGIDMLDEEQYRHLQQLEPVDTKTSSWLKTPANIRKLGGAIFGDYRFGTVFIYHNGAESYYGARGFRGMLKV